MYISIRAIVFEEPIFGIATVEDRKSIQKHTIRMEFHIRARMFLSVTGKVSMI